MTKVRNNGTYSDIELCQSKQLMIDTQRPQNFISIQQCYCAYTATAASWHISCTLYYRISSM